mgnify:CR=1 FL=1
MRIAYAVVIFLSLVLTAPMVMGTEGGTAKVLIMVFPQHIQLVSIWFEADPMVDPRQVPARAQGPDMDAGLATGLDRDMARGPAQDPAKARDPAMDLGRATDQARAIRTDRVATPPAPEIDAERLPQQPR